MATAIMFKQTIKRRSESGKRSRANARRAIPPRPEGQGLSRKMMTRTHSQQEAWAIASGDPALKNEAFNLNVITNAIVALLLAVTASVAPLALFGSQSDYMAISGLSVALILALFIWVMDGQAQASVNKNAEVTPIVNSQLKIGATLVVLATLIGHVAGFAVAPMLASFL